MEHTETLDHIRHSLAHLLAIAVLEKYPHAKLAIGPTTDTGFYYDFDFAGGETPGDDDLKGLQKTMRKLVGKGLSFDRTEITPEEARKFFAQQPYKIELINEFANEDLQLTTYTTGDFTDLCEGGHVDSTTQIDPKAFELTHIAGAYWRGDENKPMLTRIYGIAFETPEALADYKHLQEEAKKRDHRKLGKALDLFTFSPLVGAGLPLFTPKGTAMREAIVDKIKNLQQRFGYEHVWIPHITKKDLYETSGHWEKFGDELFKVQGQSDTEFVMKPMNCPHHTQIYASQARSYRDLPIRFTEATTNYRDEQAGELLGLSRVRSLTQDDGHVFCTIEHVQDEAQKIVSVIRDFYTSLSMWHGDIYWVSLSVRDRETPEKYLGKEENWEKAEEMLEKVATSEGLNYRRVEGEAAFYGPKLDFMFKDALGREWQLATIQLDFVMPERFSLEYTTNTGEKETPVMIHRAIAGSIERFMSIIIEHFAGAFPLWIAPVQVELLPIGEGHRDYAHEVYEKLKQAGIRTHLNLDNETLGKRIRTVKMAKVPYFLVIGDDEARHKTVTVEHRDGDTIGTISLQELIQRLQDEL